MAAYQSGIMRHFLIALMSLVIAGDQLQIGWKAHPENRKLLVVYHCSPDKVRGLFRVVRTWDISAEQTTLEVPRLTTPIGQPCLIGSQILRGPELTRAEWQLLMHTEGKE